MKGAKAINYITNYRQEKKKKKGFLYISIASAYNYNCNINTIHCIENN